ncbi:hypothetical protein GDO78_011606 [Eleutherodactylus coqui]|uniref:Secreted protein n=1 Tax=Eleutherodactylus coqui TaxID=57060 RepID=A0A8J6F1C1_ELECQ|nr:hypothetical protein GDO78_011606 [Eleutherodactylus coqui]
MYTKKKILLILLESFLFYNVTRFSARRSWVKPFASGIQYSGCCCPRQLGELPCTINWSAKDCLTCHGFSLFFAFATTFREIFNITRGHFAVEHLHYFFFNHGFPKSGEIPSR